MTIGGSQGVPRVPQGSRFARIGPDAPRSIDGYCRALVGRIGCEKGEQRAGRHGAMQPPNESTEWEAQPLERPERNESIARKSRLLGRLGPKREVELVGTFENHLADAIRAGSSTERQQHIDKAYEAYEAALDGVLYELLNGRCADKDSSGS